jgi:amidase
MPTTWGLPHLQDNYPQRNAIAVDRFLAAGAVLFGKTNVPLYLADWQSFNEIYGTTNNPWDVTRAPGGSSGGSAAALAAGLTGLEAGSDIGASIRNPAHYCGVYGHKPTYGVVTPRGQALPGVVAVSDISAVGPMARSAADLTLALDVMSGPDHIDGAGWQLRLPKPKQKRLREYKVAVVYTDPEAEVDQDVQKEIRAVVDFLRKNKVKVSQNARPDMVNGAPQPSTTQLFRAGYSCNVYLPSTVAPAGFASDGLPVGIQIVGPQYGDYTCIHFAHLLEREFQGFLPPPGFE